MNLRKSLLQAVLYKIHFKSISNFQLQNTNYIFKLYFKYFPQLLLKSSTKYKIQNTFNRTYDKTF